MTKFIVNNRRHIRWTGVYLFFTIIITSCPIVCYCLLCYKFMCLSVYQQKNEPMSTQEFLQLFWKSRFTLFTWLKLFSIILGQATSSHLSALEKVPVGNLGETKGNGKAPYHIWRWEARQYGAQRQVWSLYHILLFPSTCHTFCSCTGKMNMRNACCTYY